LADFQCALLDAGGMAPSSVSLRLREYLSHRGLPPDCPVEKSARGKWNFVAYFKAVLDLFSP